MSVVAQIGSLPTDLVDALIFVIGLFLGVFVDRVFPFLFRRKLLEPKLKLVNIEANESNGDFYYKVRVRNSPGWIGQWISRKAAENCTPVIWMTGQQGTLNYLNSSTEGKIDFRRESNWINGGSEKTIGLGDEAAFRLLRWDGNKEGEVWFPTDNGYDEKDDQPILDIEGVGKTNERDVRAFKEMEEWDRCEIRIAPDNSITKVVDLSGFPWDNDDRRVEWDRKTTWSRLRDAILL